MVSLILLFQDFIPFPCHEVLYYITVSSRESMLEKATTVGVLATANEDVHSLREMITYGPKGGLWKMAFLTASIPREPSPASGWRRFSSALARTWRSKRETNKKLSKANEGTGVCRSLRLLQ